MGVNKVILVGNLGKDPEMRNTSSQLPVCNFSLATGERKKEGGQWVDRTEWHNVVVFGRVAENCSQYLSKGSQVYIEGRIQTRKWQDKEGQNRYTTEIVANVVQFLSGRGMSAGGAMAANGGGATAPDVASTLKSASAIQKSGADEVSFDDDDIPF